MKAVAGILALIVVFVGVYLLFGTQTPEPVSLSYVNAAYGISFTYPDTYELQEREVGDGHRYHYSITLIDKIALANIPQNGEGPPTINVDIFQNNLDQLSLENWVRGTNFSNYKLSPDGLLTSTAVAGVPALSYAWDGLYRGESMVFAHRDNIVMLSVSFFSLDDQIRKDFDRVLLALELF